MAPQKIHAATICLQTFLRAVYPTRPMPNLSSESGRTDDFTSRFNANTLQKSAFILNALDNGWSVKKRNGRYMFRKKHGGKRDVLRKNYLEMFVHKHADMSVLEIA
jgi:hypothetical protein